MKPAALGSVPRCASNAPCRRVRIGERKGESVRRGWGEGEDEGEREREGERKRGRGGMREQGRWGEEKGVREQGGKGEGDDEGEGEGGAPAARRAAGA